MEGILLPRRTALHMTASVSGNVPVEEHKEEGVARFRLEVEEDNTRAAALYERLGYKPLDYKQMIKEFEV